MFINLLCLTIICWKLIKMITLYLWWKDSQANGLAWSQNREYVWYKVKEELQDHAVILFIGFIVLIINNY